MDERQRARVRLALRAERAFGNAWSVPKEYLDTLPEDGEIVSPDAKAAVPASLGQSAMRSGPSSANAKAPVPNRTPVKLETATSKTSGTLEIKLPPIEGEPLASEQRRIVLEALDADHVKGCTKCRLCEKRTNTVFGEGDLGAKLMFIGEGPGEDEDLSGRPFVGKAGQMLMKMIEAMGLTREQVYIANVVKCRPPGNRAPAPDEVATCTPYLATQIETIRPSVIVALGLPATHYLLSTKMPMGKLRGQFHDHRGVAVMPTYHPSYLLRNYNPETRRLVWSDLQLVMDRMGLAKPSVKSS